MKKISQTFQGRFFLENRHTKCQGICIQNTCDFILPVQNSVYQASHNSALLILWLNLCSRVYRQKHLRHFAYREECDKNIQQNFHG